MAGTLVFFLSFRSVVAATYAPASLLIRFGVWASIVYNGRFVYLR